MSDFFLNFEKKGVTTLNKVAFQSVPCTPGAESLRISIQDDIDPALTESGLLIDVIRRLRMVPDAFFSIEVSYHVMVNYSKEADRTSLEAVNIKELLLAQDRIPWISEALSKASLLISILTSDNGGHPLVTQPSFIKAK